jgi:oxysterol-binding protein 1
MKTAILKSSTSDRLRFEVHSTPSRGHSSGVQKWYMKANHPVEASRWTQAIRNSIELYKRAENNSATDSEAQTGHKSDTSSIGGAAAHAVQRAASQSMRSLSAMKRKSKHTSVMTTASTTTVGSEKDSVHSSANGDHEQDQDQEPNATMADTGLGRDGFADDEEESDSSEELGADRAPPHEDNFDLHGNATAAQMDLTSQMLADLDIPKDIKEAVSVAQRMLNEYVQMAKAREEWWKKQAERERQRQAAWEQSLAVVVKEGESLENELRLRSRKRGSRFFNGGEGGDTVKQRQSAIAGKSSPFIAEEPALASPVPLSTVPSQDSVPEEPATAKPSLSPPGRPSLPDTRMNTQDTIKGRSPDVESTYSTDEEDEFFDAIESNALPNLVVPEPLKSAGSTSTEPVPTGNELLPYEGYKNLRQRLMLTNERPPTSLWSVLKHSIGKDLTKISFPVFFNEPTSMLQRMVSWLRWLQK